MDVADVCLTDCHRHGLILEQKKKTTVNWIKYLAKGQLVDALEIPRDPGKGRSRLDVEVKKEGGGRFRSCSPETDAAHTARN